MGLQDDIQNCVKILQNGGSILYPTDTVWGLGCDATNQAAVKNLLKIKERQAFQGLIILVEDEQDIFKYSDQTDDSVFDFLQDLKKPTTVIYEKGKAVAPSVLNADGSIAMRLAKDDFCRQLLKAFGKPIVSTSANIHGEPTPSFFKEISGTLKNRVDYIVDHRKNDEMPKESSAMVRWLGDGKFETIRK